MDKGFSFTDGDGQDMTPEITRFIELIGLDDAAPERYSILLVLGLFGGFKSEKLNPAKVIQEIRALEGLGAVNRLKPPIQNKYPPLKGLWHKHYLEDGMAAFATNLLKGLKRYKMPELRQRVKDAQEAKEERYFTVDDVPAIADEAVSGNWNRLAEKQELTGEWLVYAEHEGKNYYLCLATHDSTHHQDVRRQIDAICCQEFPFLAKLLADAERELQL